MKKGLACALVLLFALAACGKEGRKTVTLGDVSGSPAPSASSEATSSAAPKASAKAAPKATSATSGGNTSSGSSDDGATASTPKPAAQGGVNPPKNGTYLYRTDGSAPSGPGQPAQTFSNKTATAKMSHTGNAYTTENTSEDRDGKSTTRTRWEATKISLLSVQIETGSNSGNLTFRCDYEPNPVIGHIPPKVETFPQQKLSGNGNACGGTLDIAVLRKETAKDATGKSWSTWVIHVKINSQFDYNGSKITTSTDDMRWFSPDLGVEIKSHTKTTTTSAFGTQKSDFTSVLKSHP